MKKKENLFSEGKLKKRYKMYKAGKSWVVAPLVFAAFGFFELGVSPVKADQVETKTKNVEDMSVYTVSAPLGQQEFVLPQTDTSEAKEARNRATSDEKNQIQPDSSGEAVEQYPSDTTTSLAEAPTIDKEVASSTSVVKELPASVGSASEQPVASTAKKESLFVSETTGSVSSIAQVELSPVSSPSATTTPASENTLVRTQVVSQKETRSAEAATFSQADSVMPKSLADQELTKDVTKVEAEQFQRIKTVSLLAKEKEVVASASFVDANAQAEVTPSADLLGASGSQLVTGADVTTAEEFQKALGSNGIKTINLQADIDYGAKYSGTQWFDQIRDLTINGNGHQIDFNDAHIVFYTKSSQAMDLTLNDLTLYAYWGWGAFSINSKSGASYLDEGVKQTIKFNNVNYYGSQTVNTKTATVVLAGKSTFVSGPNYTSKFRNDVAVQPYQQNFELSALEIEPNAQITLQTDRGGNIYINNNGTPHFTVGKNATVNIIQTNDGPKSQGEKSSALIYTRGAVTFDEGSTVNIDIKNADRYRRNTDSVIYINNGSLTLKKGAVVTVGKNSDGDLQRTLIYLNGADSKIVLAENAQLKLTNEKGLKTTNDIYMYNGGVIRINGKGAKLDIKNSGDTDYGNVYIGGAGNVFVNDGGTLSIQNKAEKENTLLYTYGSATLSFGKGANVELKGSGAGKTTLITAASNSKISIYRPDDVTFDNTSAGLASKLFDFSGELKADFVTIQSDPTGAKVGPFKEASYLLDKAGTSNSTTANVIGLDQAVTLAGKNLANKLGQARFLQYSTDGMQNTLTLADADKITPKTTRLSGTTSPDAYVTVNYYEDGQLEQIPGLNYSLTAPTETTPDYLVKADKQGAWVVELPVSLAADKVLVASSIHNLTPAYKTAFVAGSKVAVDSLAAKAVGIAFVVEHAASQAQAVTLKASDIQGSKDRATSVATQANAYQSLATAELMAGSKAASYATAALQASLTASDAQSANDQNIMQSAASAQTSYAELATSEVGNATLASANAKRALKKVEDNLSALQSNATTFIKVNSSLINSNISKIVAGLNRDNATLQNAQIKAGPKKQEISNAAEALNSAAKVLQEIARTDPTFKDEAQAKASQYTSEATTLLHELTANGSLEELRPVSDAYDQALSATSEQASDFSKALSYYANGELSSAAQNIAQADSAGITEKVQALKQHSEALNEYMTGSFPKQVAALDSLTARANVASATAYIETTALQSKEQQAKIAQLFKAVIADKAALQATNAELVSLQEKLTKFTDGYPDDEKLTSVATVLNSVASQFAQTKAQMDTAESQASQATTKATKSLKNTESTKKIFEMQVQTDAKTAAEQLPGFMVTYSNEMKSALSLAELAGSLAKRASTAALTTLGSAKMALQEATKIFTENKTKEIAEQKKAVMQAVTEVANTQNEVTTQVTAVTSQAEQTQAQVDSAKTTLAQINEMTKEHLALPEVASEVAKAQSTAQVVSRAADRLAESARAAITAQSNVATMGSEARKASASVDNALSLAQSAATQARSLASQAAMQVALDSEASVASQAQVTAHEAVLSAQSSANKAEDVLTSLATLKLQTGNLATQIKRAVTELALNKQKIQRALDLAAARSYAQLASTAASQAQVAETTAESELERARLAQSQATSSATEVNTLAGQTKELLAKVATIATKLSELTAPHVDNTGFMHEVTQASNAAAKASLADQAISQATMLASSAASDASSAYQVASTAKRTVSLEASTASSAAKEATSYAVVGDKDHASSAASVASQAKNRATSADQTVSQATKQAQAAEKLASQAAQSALDAKMQASEALAKIENANSNALAYLAAGSYATKARQAFENTSTAAVQINEQATQVGQMFTKTNELLDAATENVAQTEMKTPQILALAKTASDLAAKYPAVEGLMAEATKASSAAMQASVAASAAQALTAQLQTLKQANAKHEQVASKAQQIASLAVSAASSANSVATSQAKLGAVLETKSAAKEATSASEQAIETNQKVSAEVEQTRNSQVAVDSLAKEAMTYASESSTLLLLADSAASQAERYVTALNQAKAAEEVAIKVNTVKANVEKYLHQASEANSTAQVLTQTAKAKKEKATEETARLTSLVAELTQMASEHPQNSGVATILKEKTSLASTASVAVNQVNDLATTAVSAAAEAMAKYPEVLAQANLSNSEASEATSVASAAQSFALKAAKEETDSLATVASEVATKAELTEQTATSAATKATSAAELTATTVEKMKVPQATLVQVLKTLQNAKTQAQQYLEAEKYGLAALLAKEATLQASQAVDSAKGEVEQVASETSTVAKKVQAQAEHSTSAETLLTSLAEQVASLASKYPTNASLEALSEHAAKTSEQANEAISEAVSVAAVASSAASVASEDHQAVRNAQLLASIAISEATSATVAAQSFASLGDVTKASSAASVASVAAKKAASAQQTALENTTKASQAAVSATEATTTAQQKQSLVANAVLELQELASQAKRYANALAQADLAASEVDRADIAKSNATEQAERLAKKATSSKEDVTKAATQINGSVEQTTAVLPATDSAATKTNELGTNATKLATLITSLAQADPAVFASLAVPRKTSEAKAKAISAVSEATNALSQAQSAASVARDEDRKASQAKDKASLAASEATSAATLAQSYAVLGDANNATSAAMQASLAFAVANEAKKAATIALAQATQAKKEATRANSQAATAQAKATDAVTELNRLKELTTRYVNALAQATQADKARAQVQELSTELKPFVSQASVAAREALVLATSTSSGADATANAGVKASELVKELATLASEHQDISELAKLSEQAQTTKTQFDTALAATRSAASEATTFASLATAKYLAVSAADSLVDLSVNEVNSTASAAQSYALAGAESQATSLDHLASLSATKVNDVYVNASNAAKDAKLQFEQSSQAEQKGKTNATKARSMLEKLNDLLKTAKLYVKADEQADLAEKTALAFQTTKMQVDSDVAKVSMSASEAQALAKSAGANAQQIAHLKAEATELTKALSELANNVAIPRLEELAKQALTTQKQVVEVANGADKLATKAKNTASDVMQALKTTSEVAATVTSLGAKATHLASTARSYAVLGDVAKATSVAQTLLELSAEADELKEQSKATPSQAENKAKTLSEDVKKVVEQHDQVSLAVTQLAKVKEQAKHYVQAALYASSAQEEVKTAVGLKDKLASYATQASEAVSDVLNLAPKASSAAKKAQNLASKVSELVAQITLLATDPDNEKLTAQAKELQKFAQGALSEALSAAEVAQNSAHETSAQYALISEADLLAKQAVAKAQSGADLAESYAAFGNDSQALSITTSVKKAGAKVSAAEAKARPSASQVMQNKQTVAKETRKILQKEQQVDSVVTQLTKLLSDVTHYNQAKMQAQSLAELAKLQAAKLLNTDHTSQAYKAALAATSLASNTALVAEQAQTSSAQVPTLLAQITSLAEQTPADQKLAKFVVQANEAKLVVTSALQAITDANATTTHLASEAEKNYQATSQAEQDVRNAGAQVTSGASEAQSYALAGDLAQVKNVAKDVDLALSQAELASQTAKEAATKAQQNATDALTAAKVGQVQMVQLKQALAKLNELKADLADYAKARELAKEAKEIATNAQQAHVKSTEQVAQSAKEVAKIQALSAMTNELDTNVKEGLSQIPALVEAVTSAAQVYPEAVELADLSKEALSLQASGAMLASEVAESKTFASALDEEVQKLQRSAQTALQLASEATSEAVSTADVVQNHALTGTLAQALSAAEHTSEATIKASDAEENTRALVEAVDHKGDMAESLAKETQAKKVELEQLLAKLSQLGTKAKQLLDQAKHTVQEKVVAENLKATKGELANYLKLASEAVVKAQDKATQAKHDATKAKELDPRMLLVVEDISSLAKTAPTNDGLQHLKALAQTIKADIFEVPKEAEVTATEASVLAEATKKAYQAVREANLRVELAPNDPQKAFEALEKVKALTPKVVEQATKALQKAQSTQAKRVLFEQTLAQLEGMKAQAERYAQAEAKAHEIEATALEVKDLASASYASQASSAASVAKAATAQTVTLASQIKTLLKELKEDPTELMQVVTQLTTKASLVDLETTKDLAAVTQALSDFAQAKTTATNVAKEAVRAAKTGALEAVTSLATVASEVAQKSARAQQTAQTKAKMAGEAAKNAQALVSEMTKYLEQVKSKLATQTQAKENEQKTSLADQFQRKAQELADLSRTVTSYAKDLSLILSEADIFAVKAQKSAKQTREAMALAASLLTSMAQNKVSSLAEKQAQSIASTAKLTFKEFRLAQQQVTVVADEHRLSVTMLGMLEQALRKVDVEAKNDVSKDFECIKVIEQALTKAHKARLELQNVLAKAKEAKQNVVAHAQSAAEYEQQTLALLALLKNKAQTSAELPTAKQNQKETLTSDVPNSLAEKVLKKESTKQSSLVLAQNSTKEEVAKRLQTSEVETRSVVLVKESAKKELAEVGKRPQTNETRKRPVALGKRPVQEKLGKVAELPQTGETKAKATPLSGLGVLSASLLGLLGLGKKRRKEK